jgi:hypothetical protein
MIDRLFFSLLTFCLLAAGTATIASTLIEPAPLRVVQLPTVTVIGKRTPDPTEVARNEAVETPTAKVMQ